MGKPRSVPCDTAPALPVKGARARTVDGGQGRGRHERQCTHRGAEAAGRALAHQPIVVTPRNPPPALAGTPTGPATAFGQPGCQGRAQVQELTEFVRSRGHPRSCPGCGVRPMAFTVPWMDVCSESPHGAGLDV